ncbi:MAG: hypothetical protein R3D68_05860 [Hyphomicrobiaceae bacterium]
MHLIDSTPVYIFVLLALTLGLAPFVPEPHLVEKLKMLWAGTLTKPIDIFDLLMHATPWFLLIFKLSRLAMARGA